MKRTLFIVITCFIASGVLGQETTTPEVNTKFGKPSDEELKMTVYEPDTTAAAVVLCKKTNVFYDVVNNDFRINYREPLLPMLSYRIMRTRKGVP